MMKAIERIKGYCCKVNQKQWEELVKVADEVGCPVACISRRYGTEMGVYPIAHANGDHITAWLHQEDDEQLIPFTEFLSKLKGDEEWKPEYGEIVEVSNGGEDWCLREYIGFRSNYHVCWQGESSNTLAWSYIRKPLPAMTRAEAEKKFHVRIID